VRKVNGNAQWKAGNHAADTMVIRMMFK